MATVLVAIPDPEACERCRVDTVPFAQQAAPFVTPRTRVIEGVTYWEHDSTALARAPRLAVEAAPIAVAGGAGEDPAFDLSDVHDVALLRDGRLAAFVPLGTRLLVFGADGRGPRSLARRGQGPGELMGVSNMAIAPGDTLVAPDLGTMRLNWIDSDRGVARSDPLFGRLPTRVSDAVGVLPGGQVVMFSPGYLRPGRSSEVTRASIPLVVLPPQGAGRVIATLPGVETVMLTTRYEGRSGKEPVAVGFGRNSRAAMWDSVIATGSNDRYRIDLRNSEGTVVAAITVATRRRAVTEAMRRADIEARLKQLAEYRERPRDPAESQRLIREQPYADSLPHFTYLFVSAKTLWVLDPVVPSDTIWWATQFRRDGTLLGRVHGPTTGTPMAFGDDRVVLRTMDADGLVALEVHRIVSERRR